MIYETIRSLNDFANIKKDEEFIDFTQRLLTFVESQKNIVNINNHETFKGLIKQHLLENDNADELDKKQGYLAMSISYSLLNYGMLDFEKFYNEYKELFKEKMLDVQKPYDDYKEDIANQSAEHQELIDLLKENEALTESTRRDDELQESEALEKQKSQTSENEIQNEHLQEKDKKGKIKPIEPDSMLAFINNEEVIEFPFSREESLDNPKFIRKFHERLNAFKRSDIQALIDKVKAKNEILKQRIEEFDKEKRLIKELNENQELSNKTASLNEQSSLDSLNERFTQALEEHKQNQRERYGNPQEQDNNNNSTESKKSYKRSRK